MDSEEPRCLGIRLLGTPAPEADGVAVDSTSERLRTLLALLAVAPGAAVPAEVLVDELWGEDLPRDPLAALSVLVTRLRKWLRAAGSADVLRRGRAGYVLDVPPASVDLERFHAAVGTAMADDGDAGLLLAAGAEGLELWRGEPFEGTTAGQRLGAERVRAVERLLRLLDRHAGRLIACGRAEDAVDVLLPHLERHRDRERLTVLAMTALDEAGRRAEALEVFATTDRFLRDEWGVAPSSAITELHRRLVAQGRRPTRREPTRRRRAEVGREAPLATVLDLLDVAAHGGRGALVVVEGVGGIGKSALLETALLDAGRRGAAVASGGWGADSGPLEGWRVLLAELGIALPRREDGPLGTVLRQELADRATEAPLLVALDDVHRADSASVGVLRTLARVGVPPGLVVLVGARPRPEAHPAWADALDALVTADGTVHLGLEELGEPAARELVGRRLSRFAPGEVTGIADAVLARAGGHPLHLASLLDALAAQPDAAAARRVVDRAPDRLRPLLHQQADLLPAECRAALSALAVLRPISLPALAGALGTSAGETARRLGPALAAGLVGLGPADADGTREVGFRHEITAGALLEGLDDGVRARVHRDRWAVLAATPAADPFERLRHALGGAGLVPATAIDAARSAAGRAAYDRGAVEEALALLDAVAVPPDSSTSLYRGLSLAALARTEEADAVLDAIVDDASVSVADAVLAAVGHDPMGTAVAGDPRRLARLHRVLERVDDPAVRLDVLRRLVWEEELVHGEAVSVQALAELDELCERLEDTDDVAVLAQIRAFRSRRLVEAPVPAAHRAAVSEDARSLALRSGDVALEMETTELALSANLAAGNLQRAEDLRWHLDREARRRHRPRPSWSVLLIEATLHLARGEVEAADAVAQRALLRGQELGLPDALGAFGVHLLARHWLAGSLPSLGGLPARAAAHYQHIPAWSAAAAVDEIQAGRPDAAADHLETFRRGHTDHHGRPFARPGLCLAAAAAFSLGDTETAEMVRKGLPADPTALVTVGVGAGVFGPLDLFVALADLTLGDADRARSRLRRSAALAAGLGWGAWAEVGERLVAWVEGRPPPHGPTLITPADAVLPLGLTAPPAAA